MSRFLFFIQGDGRGHMTQAIALKQILEEEGHTVCEFLAGKKANGSIPDYVKEKARCPVSSFESPGFVMDAQNKAIRLGRSVWESLFRVKEYRRSFEFIRQKMLEHQPDIIINFYEPLIGLFYFFNDPPIPLVSFAHQYIYNHPGFEFPVRGRIKDKIAIKFYTQLTSLRSKKQFALSFYPINDNVRRSIIGTPPLLRRELFEQKTETRNFILIYLLKGGYREDIIEWHKKNPQVELHCFTDNNQEYDTVMYSANLSFHKLNDKNFLEKMAAAKGLVTTAGFESVCEAMYLGKPIMMVPVQGHFEQFCNARDAAKAGAGIYSDAFHIEMFFDYLSAGKWDHQQFRLWVDSAKDKILQHLDELLQKAEPYNPMVPAF